MFSTFELLGHPLANSGCSFWLEKVQLAREKVSLDHLRVARIIAPCYNQFVTNTGNRNRGCMKYTLEQITRGEDEIIIRYKSMTSEVEKIIGFLQDKQKYLYGNLENEKVIVKLSQILYVESVDGRTYGYTDSQVVRLDYSLAQLEGALDDINFFRCSKSMMINIDKVKTLRSLASNRIEATMCNGESVLISRTYASDFRKRLKRGIEP